jgi:hypothetical protein
MPARARGREACTAVSLAGHHDGCYASARSERRLGREGHRFRPHVVECVDDETMERIRRAHVEPGVGRRETDLKRVAGQDVEGQGIGHRERRRAHAEPRPSGRFATQRHDGGAAVGIRGLSDGAVPLTVQALEVEERDPRERIPRRLESDLFVRDCRAVSVAEGDGHRGQRSGLDRVGGRLAGDELEPWGATGTVGH